MNQEKCRHCNNIMTSRGDMPIFDCNDCNFATIISKDHEGESYFLNLNNIIYVLKEYKINNFTSSEISIFSNFKNEKCGELEFEGFKDLEFHRNKLRKFVQTLIL